MGLDAPLQGADALVLLSECILVLVDDLFQLLNLLIFLLLSDWPIHSLDLLFVVEAIFALWPIPWAVFCLAGLE